MINKHAWIIILLFLLSACGIPESATPAPTLQAINLVFPVALQPWADKLGVCASGNPGVGLYFMPSESSQSSLQSNDIALTLGEPSTHNGSIAYSQVGWEQVVVIANRENNIAQLTLAELRSIFSGQMATWDFGAKQPIQVWLFADGDPVRIVFDNTVMTGHSITTEAMLAPDQGAMLEAIANHVSAIGYTTESYLATAAKAESAKVKILPLADAPEGFHQPVVAITAGEPQGLVRDLLVCLQDNNP